MDGRVKIIAVDTRLRIKRPMKLAEAIVRHRLVRSDFAASLTGVFGISEDALAFVRGEREAWGA